MSEKPKLFLLPHEFADPALPGERFLCKHCMLVEGVLAAFPALRGEIDIEVVPFARPRDPVIASIGEANQSLPVLVLPAGATARAATGSASGKAFASGGEAIVATLAERFGLPAIHP